MFIYVWFSSREKGHMAIVSKPSYGLPLAPGGQGLMSVCSAAVADHKIPLSCSSRHLGTSVRQIRIFI